MLISSIRYIANNLNKEKIKWSLSLLKNKSSQSLYKLFLLRTRHLKHFQGH